MYNPCFECQNKYNRWYSDWCDENCTYAHEIAKLKPYGGIDEAVKCMKGEAVPVRLLRKENLDFVSHMVEAAKAGIV